MMTTPAPADLAATEFIDHDSPKIAGFVARVVRAGGSVTEQAIDLYYAVRDGIRYEIYGADLSPEGLRASSVLRTGTGMCIHKSVLFLACLRSIGVPSRLVLADVRNHLTSDRLKDLMGGDVFRHHCYTAVFLERRWIKATPVFNRTLCRLYGIAQLEFDGTSDSLYHPYDLEGRRHMEFMRVYGEFDDLPYERIIRDLRTAHPGLFGDGARFADGSLVVDAAAGTSHEDAVVPERPAVTAPRRAGAVDDGARP